MLNNSRTKYGDSKLLKLTRHHQYLQNDEAGIQIDMSTSLALEAGPRCHFRNINFMAFVA